MLRGDGRRLVFSHTVLDQFIIKNVTEELRKRNFWSVDKRTQSNTNLFVVKTSFFEFNSKRLFILKNEIKKLFHR